MKILKTPYSFIPKKLETKDRPELTFFPYNVMFMSRKKVNQKIISGTALYYPMKETFVAEDHIYSMQYENSLSNNAHIIIYYNTENEFYIGEKFVNGIKVGSAIGDDWKSFFIHFTALGLLEGEPCNISEPREQDLERS